MKWYIYKIPRKNKQFGGHEICRSKEKVIFSDLFPSMQKAIEIIEDIQEVKPKPKKTGTKGRKTKTAINEEVNNVD